MVRDINHFFNVNGQRESRGYRKYNATFFTETAATLQSVTLTDVLTKKKEFVRVSELCFPQCGGCVCVEVKIGFLSLLIRWRLPGMFNVLLTYY